MPGDLETINPGRESASKFNRIHAKLAERGVISSDGSILIDSTPVGVNLRARPPFIPPTTGRSVYRLEVTATAPGGDTALVLAQKYLAGGSLDGTDVAVVKNQDHSVGDEILAAQIGNGTGATYSGDDVTWEELLDGAGTPPTTVDVSVITSYRVDGATNKLQIKTTTVTVLAAGTESAWTDIHTGTECAAP
jgi:hypothetical protein